jgi:hypothetical protein
MSPRINFGGGGDMVRPVRILSILIVLALFALPLAAQTTIVHGESLSALIRNLYGGDGITLDKSIGHEAHFGNTLSLQQFTDVLQRSLQSRSVFPIPSAAGIFSYKFDEATGTYQRVESTLGPVLSERATTAGKGNVTFSLGYTFGDYSLVDGREKMALTLTHCTTVACVGSNPDLPIFKDVIQVDLLLRLKSQALTGSVIYGLTNRVDVGILVPYIRNDLSVTADAEVVHAPGSNPVVHRFDPLVETPGQYGTAHAVGIGDIVLRAKYKLPTRVDVAILGDAILPTGDRENFLGTGETRLRGFFVASKTGTHLSPHMNLGVEWNLGNEELSSFDYRLGTEWGLSPRLTLVGDLIGTARPLLDDEFTADALKTQRLVGKSEIDFSVGAKWRINDTSVLVLNVLHPANDEGLRPEMSTTFGVQMALK